MEAVPVRQFRQQTNSPADGESGRATSSVSWRRLYVWRVFVALLGGLALRLWMHVAFPQTGGDDLIYGNIARNLVLRGQFALSDGSGVPHATLIRLPGYPFFLAVIFRIFGIDNLNAVAGVQIVLELVACLLLADFVRRIATPRAGMNTLWLAALCPFTAVYAGGPLAESLTLDMICLALWALQRIVSPEPDSRFRGINWVLFAIAISLEALLRPDGGLLGLALWPALLLIRPVGTSFRRVFAKALLCAGFALLPFVAWTIRNWNTFHVFQPLAPRYANDPSEPPRLGWEHWVKTWCLDFTCTSEIYWNVPDGAIAFADLPATWPNPAYDSAQEEAATKALFDDYNLTQTLSAATDSGFEALARQRANSYPWRTHLFLPVGRFLDMLLRPRVENLTIDLHWWEYNHHYAETRFSWSYAGLNLVLLLLGIWGLWYRPTLWGCIVAYVFMRSLLLMTVGAPETRYTLEFFPMMFATGGIALQRVFHRPPAAKRASGSPSAFLELS